MVSRPGELNEDGFRTRKEPDGLEFLCLESARLDEYIAYYKKNRSYGFTAARVFGFTGNDVNFLRETPGLKVLSLQEEMDDISGLQGLRELEWLLFSGSPQILDLSYFPNLSAFYATWSPKITNLCECRKLEELLLGKFRPSGRSFSELSCATSVKRLWIRTSPVKSLSGIEGMTNLNSLELSYFSKLESVEPLLALRGQLVELELDSCKKIKDWGTLGQMASLTKLQLSRLGSIPSLRFIETLRELEFISFVDTNIEDGDLSVLLELPKLTYAGFFNKKNFSHKFEEVESILKSRQASS